MKGLLKDNITLADKQKYSLEDITPNQPRDRSLILAGGPKSY